MQAAGGSELGGRLENTGGNHGDDEIARPAVRAGTLNAEGIGQRQAHNRCRAGQSAAKSVELGGT
jgi:hypothetical protein